MNPLHVKICGMKDPQNMVDIARLRPDMMGFIFYSKSPRWVGEHLEIPNGIDPAIQRVGVFVDEDADIVARHVDTHQLACVQLHGHEKVSYTKELVRNNIKVMKVFHIDDDFDFKATESYKDSCEFFLFDTRGTQLGGNGISFTWSKLNEYDQEIPFFLSGGITVHHLPALEALEGMNVVGIDVNSGVEVSPGLKDVKKVAELLDKLRG